MPQRALVTAIPRAKHHITSVTAVMRLFSCEAAVSDSQPPEAGIAPGQEYNDALRVRTYILPRDAGSSPA